jgi:hypothetical protein
MPFGGLERSDKNEERFGAKRQKMKSGLEQSDKK